MNKLFLEFENENAYRTYPFASGCTVRDTNGNRINTGILIDAALYPVNPTGTLYLSSIEVIGIVNISDDTGVIMTAEFVQGSSVLNFYDTTCLTRHVGTIIASSVNALSILCNVSEDRKFSSSETQFASSCIFPIVNDGVLSVNVGDTGCLDGAVSFANTRTDEIRVSTNGSNLRFDVIPLMNYPTLTSIKHIYCVVDGKTPFRIEKIPFNYEEGSTLGNTIAVYLDNIDRNDICSNVHREDAYEMRDTCECEESSNSCPEPLDPVDIPSFYQVEVVDIPNGAENAFYLAVPNMTGYDNPLSLTFGEDSLIPKTTLNIDKDQDNTDELKDDLSSKTVVLQVPGLQA